MAYYEVEWEDVAGNKKTTLIQSSKKQHQIGKFDMMDLLIKSGRKPSRMLSLKKTALKRYS
jgi:hypothetical protein